MLYAEFKIKIHVPDGMVETASQEGRVSDIVEEATDAAVVALHERLRERLGNAVAAVREEVW